MDVTIELGKLLPLIFTLLAVYIADGFKKNNYGRSLVYFKTFWKKFLLIQLGYALVFMYTVYAMYSTIN